MAASGKRARDAATCIALFHDDDGGRSVVRAVVAGKTSNAENGPRATKDFSRICSCCYSTRSSDFIRGGFSHPSRRPFLSPIIALRDPRGCVRLVYHFTPFTPSIFLDLFTSSLFRHWTRVSLGCLSLLRAVQRRVVGHRTAGKRRATLGVCRSCHCLKAHCRLICPTRCSGALQQQQQPSKQLA